MLGLKTQGLLSGRVPSGEALLSLPSPLSEIREKPSVGGFWGHQLQCLQGLKTTEMHPPGPGGQESETKPSGA